MMPGSGTFGALDTARRRAADRHASTAMLARPQTVKPPCGPRRRESGRRPLCVFVAVAVGCSIAAAILAAPRAVRASPAVASMGAQAARSNLEVDVTPRSAAGGAWMGGRLTPEHPERLTERVRPPS